MSASGRAIKIHGARQRHVLQQRYHRLDVTLPDIHLAIDVGRVAHEEAEVSRDRIRRAIDLVSTVFDAAGHGDRTRPGRERLTLHVGSNNMLRREIRLYRCSGHILVCRCGHLVTEGVEGHAAGFCHGDEIRAADDLPARVSDRVGGTGEVRVDDIVVGVHLKLVVAVLVVGVPCPRPGDLALQGEDRAPQVISRAQ